MVKRVSSGLFIVIFCCTPPRFCTFLYSPPLSQVTGPWSPSSSNQPLPHASNEYIGVNGCKLFKFLIKFQNFLKNAFFKSKNYRVKIFSYIKYRRWLLILYQYSPPMLPTNIFRLLIYILIYIKNVFLQVLFFHFFSACTLVFYRMKKTHVFKNISIK